MSSILGPFAKGGTWDKIKEAAERKANAGRKTRGPFDRIRDRKKVRAILPWVVLYLVVTSK